MKKMYKELKREFKENPKEMIGNVIVITLLFSIFYFSIVIF